MKQGTITTYDRIPMNGVVKFKLNGTVQHVAKSDTLMNPHAEAVKFNISMGIFIVISRVQPCVYLGQLDEVREVYHGEIPE